MQNSGEIFYEYARLETPTIKNQEQRGRQSKSLYVVLGIVGTGEERFLKLDGKIHQHIYRTQEDDRGFVRTRYR